MNDGRHNQTLSTANVVRALWPYEYRAGLATLFYVGLPDLWQACLANARYLPAAPVRQIPAVDQAQGLQIEARDLDPRPPPIGDKMDEKQDEINLATHAHLCPKCRVTTWPCKRRLCRDEDFGSYCCDSCIRRMVAEEVLNQTFPSP